MLLFKLRCNLLVPRVPDSFSGSWYKQETRKIHITSTSGTEMAGRGTKLWHYLVLTCLSSAAFSAEIPEKDGEFCEEIHDGEERDVDLPLYVGLYPIREEWKWEADFKGGRGKSIYHLSLHSDGEKIEIEVQVHKAKKTAQWTQNSFPLSKWSYLAIYSDGNFLVVQKQDLIITSKHQKRRIVKTTMTTTINVSGVDVTYNCISGHLITHRANTMEVRGDCLYFLQSIRQSMTLSSALTTPKVRSDEWYDIVNQTEKYSFDGEIFVVEICDSALVQNWGSPAVLSTVGIPETTNVLPNVLKDQSTQPEQPAAPTSTDIFAKSMTTEPSALSTSSRTDVKTTEPSALSTISRVDVKTTEPSALSKSSRMEVMTTTATSPPPEQAASGGTVAAVVIVLLLVMVAAVVSYKKGYVAEAFRFCCETVFRRREVTLEPQEEESDCKEAKL